MWLCDCELQVSYPGEEETPIWFGRVVESGVYQASDVVWMNQINSGGAQRPCGPLQLEAKLTGTNVRAGRLPRDATSARDIPWR